MSFTYPKGLFHKFTFGHFEGLTLLEIYRGSVPISKVVVQCIFEHIIHEFKPFGISQEHNFIINCDGGFIHMLPIKHEAGLYDDENDLPSKKNDYEANFELINSFFKKELTYEFKSANQGNNAFVIDLNKIAFYDRTKHKEVIFTISPDFSKITYKGSPSYIDWCINNIVDFFVSPDTFDTLESMNICIFERFELEKLSDTLYKILQFQKTYKYKFSEKTKQTNLEKFAIFKVKRDAELENRKWVEKYGDEPRKHYTEQDYIDDAFGGEASAYWNVD